MNPEHHLLEDVLGILSRADTARDEAEQLVVQLAPRSLRPSRHGCPTHRQPHPPPVEGPQQVAFAAGSQQDPCWVGLQQELSSPGAWPSSATTVGIVSLAGGSSAATTGS